MTGFKKIGQIYDTARMIANFVIPGISTKVMIVQVINNLFDAWAEIFCKRFPLGALVKQ
jgi:hypothetical protein